MHYVQAADAEPRERPAMHYAATARMMAECVGSALAEDFADASIKEALAAGLPASGSEPFSAGGGEGWAEFTVTPAHRALALRVQGRAQARAFLAIRRATPGVGGALRRVMPRAPRAAGTSRRQWARWQNMCRRRASKWKRRRKAIICPSRSRPLLSRWRDRIRGGGAAAARAGADQRGRARRFSRRGPPDGGGHASLRKAREGVARGVRAGRARRGVCGIGRGSQGATLSGKRRGRRFAAAFQAAVEPSAGSGHGAACCPVALARAGERGSRLAEVLPGGTLKVKMTA